jgi:hypothetical protein
MMEPDDELSRELERIRKERDKDRERVCRQYAKEEAAARGEELPPMRMYILILESVPVGFALVAAAHASVTAYLKFQDTLEAEEWVDGPFYKTVCKVNDAEFEAAKDVPDHVVITESALNGQEVALAFKPRDEYPQAFKYYRLYR